MIKVKQLIKLLQEVPPDADVYAYEGEVVGIAIKKGKAFWWIGAGEGGQNEARLEQFSSYKKDTKWKKN